MFYLKLGVLGISHFFSHVYVGYGMLGGTLFRHQQYRKCHYNHVK